MTSNENLMVTVIEECAEISQAVSKAMRFGLDSYHPDDPHTSNADSIMTEYYQLCAVIEMLQARCVFPVLSDERISEIIQNKIDKVTKYQAVSAELGLIEGYATSLERDERYKPYPILGTSPKQYIPYGLLMMHEGQALENHGQSFEQLAQRGGLSWAEALAIIENKKWRYAEHDDRTAEVLVRMMADKYMKS